MAVTSLLALLDNIATVMDDVATLTNVAAKKSMGILGDDLALNAEQVAGVRAERELPVVWAVAKRVARQQGHPGSDCAEVERIRAVGDRSTPRRRGAPPALRVCRKGLSQAQPRQA